MSSRQPPGPWAEQQAYGQPGPYQEQEYGGQTYGSEAYGHEAHQADGHPAYEQEYAQQSSAPHAYDWPRQQAAQPGAAQATDAYPPYYDAYDPYAEPEPDPAVQPTVIVGEAERAPGYTLPDVQESAWDVDTRRSKLLGRVALLFLLLVQAGLSLRLTGTAFEDEALYIGAGHYELNNLLHGTKLPADFAGYFSGHPQLYPVLAAAVDSSFGLTGVRMLSLGFMLSTTALLYAVTRRLFNLRAALGAAALFSVLQSTTVLGNFATYDAAAIFLLALAMYAVVRTDRMRSVAVLLAAPPAALAFAVKYAAGLYLPTLVLLAIVTAHRHRSAKAVVRGVVLAAGIAALLGAVYVLSEPLGGISSTTTNRAHGSDSALTLLQYSAEWGGLVFLTALGGSIAYTLRGRMGEMPWIEGVTPGRWRRAALGALLTGTALLAPAYQIHLQTQVSLFKHVGFGLLFAAPMAGLGMARLIGPHFRHPQLGIMLYVLTLVFGMVQAQKAYSFPDSSQMVAYLRTTVDHKGRYLAEEYEVPAYYLRDVTGWNQWQSTFSMDYRDKTGTQYTGPDAYRHAVQDGRFDVIVIRGNVTPDTDQAVLEGLKGNTHYRLAGVFPYTTSNGQGAYRVWVKR
ncbi:glycosyltransferase family 39 protein [Streptomyces cynarae]|uniref:glycosyltransferase family 39 protein n=1 Tax=Streptomyces cynarae TaxID=2981134 RepID=UPI00406C4ADC